MNGPALTIIASRSSSGQNSRLDRRKKSRLAARRSFLTRSLSFGESCPVRHCGCASASSFYETLRLVRRNLSPGYGRINCNSPTIRVWMTKSSGLVGWPYENLGPATESKRADRGHERCNV
jgi:hypothetical protein